MFTSSKKIYVLAWLSLQTSSTVTIIKIKHLSTWCTKTFVGKSAVLLLTVSLKIFAIPFMASNISFWLLRSLSASLSTRGSKSSWSLLWLSWGSLRLLYGRHLFSAPAKPNSTTSFGVMFGVRSQNFTPLYSSWRYWMRARHSVPVQ